MLLTQVEGHTPCRILGVELGIAAWATGLYRAVLYCMSTNSS